MTAIQFPRDVSVLHSSLSAISNRFEYLTPDALMAYCASRLRTIDSEIHTKFAMQTSSTTARSALTLVKEKVAAEAEGIVKSTESDASTRAARCKSISDAMQKAIETLPAGDATRTALEAMKGAFDATAGDAKADNGGISKKEMADFTAKLDAMTSDLSSAGELNMIQLQSLMSQRQMAVQMTTNLVQSLGQALQTVAGNVGK